MQTGDLLADKYRLDVPIGQGAMGVVWRAIQLELDRPVAVKILHANLAERGDARARFVREARVAATLTHENAVRVLDFGEAPGGLFLVMELVAGQTLRACLDAAPLPRAEALQIALAIARVLEAAHRINLVHRDIKPENTFVDRTADGPDVRVVDFGLAFIADPTSSIGRMTDEGILGGTPAYMSPEQARGKAVGPASDVYSLGCTLYEMLAGRPPFLGQVAELLTRHAYAPPLALRELELEPPIEPAIDELVLAMLGKSPPLRPTAAAVAAALVAALTPADGPSGALRLRERSDRVLPRPAALDDGADDPATIAIAVDGPLDEELRLELAVAGVRTLAPGAPGTPVAVFAPGATLARLAELVAAGVPVVTDVPAGDFDGVAARVRVGCRDALPRPVRAEQLARKLRRLAGHRRPSSGPPAK
ncbi:MAG: serine/threonine protein kinase [Myxococcales bacterium]|nr:serine/threonine protein kinase [Myxococcales bacterium]